MCVCVCNTFVYNKITLLARIAIMSLYHCILVSRGLV